MCLVKRYETVRADSLIRIGYRVREGWNVQLLAIEGSSTRRQRRVGCHVALPILFRNLGRYGCRQNLAANLMSPFATFLVVFGLLFSWASNGSGLLSSTTNHICFYHS